MPYFAKIENNIVVDVKELEYYELNSLSGEWFETSYLAIGGKFIDLETMQPIESTVPPLRKNFPLIGFTYDRNLDAFIPAPIHKLWVLNKETCLWEAPTPKPESKNNEIYFWNDELENWDIWRI